MKGRTDIDWSAAADNALAEIREKASALQTQVAGMFEKTLDAAIANFAKQRRVIISPHLYKAGES